jgi:6-phosphogluconolactonase/glucosamine-6-phosphate isomerase/deaminase
MSNLIITEDTAKEAGEHITNIIKEHVGDVICLLAGGSALDIIEHIHPGKKCFHSECQKNPLSDETLCDKTECRTIFMMGDERVSREPGINNFLRIKTRYPNHALLQKTIETIPELDETENNFSERIEKTFLETLLTLNNPKIIFVLGVGTDGHTAGIFPMRESSFRSTYREDKTYVPVHLESLKIDSRASFTPAFILEHADELVGYIVGKDKQNILTELNSNDKKLNERPAEILKLHKRVTVYTDLDITSEEPKAIHN